MDRGASQFDLIDSGTLNHIYVVDLIWQAHLERGAVSTPTSEARHCS